MKKLKLFLLASMSALVLAACGGGGGGANDANDAADEGEVFKVAYIPALENPGFETAMKKIEGILDEALPQDVELEIFPDYNAVVESLNFGHIQMAYLGPSTYVIANDRSGAQAVVTQLINGSPFYHSYIISHEDSPWDNIEEMLADVEDVHFAFGDVNSTSGALVPSVELRNREVYEDENTYSFKEVTFTGSHDATGAAVQNKHVDAGAIDSAFFDKLVAEGILDESQIKILWKSEPLFQYPWTVASDVDEETTQLIRDTFLAIDDEEIFSGMGITGFAEATDEDYEPIRQVMKETGKLD